MFPSLLVQKELSAVADAALILAVVVELAVHVLAMLGRYALFAYTMAAEQWIMYHGILVYYL